jgi:ribose transport system ATP-binding protein
MLLTDVSFDVLPGEVHALLGENGAGKSTLVNVASGATTPDSGTISLAGAPVEHLKPAIAQGLGIAIVHQHPALLPDMTVAENILVAVGREHLRRRDPDIRKAMRSLLDDVHFAGHLEDRVSSLSVSRRHLLELAKAFAVSPRVLILDEPTAPCRSTPSSSSSLPFAGWPRRELPSSISPTDWARYPRSPTA